MSDTKRFEHTRASPRRRRRRRRRRLRRRPPPPPPAAAVAAAEPPAEFAAEPAAERATRRAAEPASAEPAADRRRRRRRRAPPPAAGAAVAAARPRAPPPRSGDENAVSYLDSLYELTNGAAVGTLGEGFKRQVIGAFDGAWNVPYPEKCASICEYGTFAGTTYTFHSDSAGNNVAQCASFDRKFIDSPSFGYSLRFYSAARRGPLCRAPSG